MPLRNRLAAIFSPTRRLLSAEAPVLQSGGLLGPVAWIAPRAECRYRRVDFSQVAPRQRGAAAGIAARREQATPDAVSRIAWTGSVAHIWTRRRLRATEPRDWMPESLARPAPSADGSRLVRCVNGVEGQVWRAGSPAASQWWPERPGLDQWHRFLRGAGLSPDERLGVPEPQVLGWARPWGSLRGGARSGDSAERVAWRAVLGGLALALGWQVAAHQRWAEAGRAVEARMQLARGSALPLLDARERADAAAARIGRLVALQSPISDYVLMAEVLAPLPADARLGAWQRQEGKLGVTVLSAESDPRVFVGAYATHPRLARVQAVPAAPGSMQLAFELAPPGKESSP